jgi:hypothetical protein
MHDGVPCTHDHSADPAADEHARIANTKKRIEVGPVENSACRKFVVTARNVFQGNVNPRSWG